MSFKSNPDQQRWLQERLEVEKEKMKAKQQGDIPDGSSVFKDDGPIGKVIVMLFWLALLAGVIFILFIW